MKLERYMNEAKIDLKKYPELDKIAKDIAKKTGDMINASVRNVKSEMPYKAQYVLEEVVNILKDAI